MAKKKAIARRGKMRYSTTTTATDSNSNTPRLAATFVLAVRLAVTVALYVVGRPIGLSVPMTVLLSSK